MHVVFAGSVAAGPLSGARAPDDLQHDYGVALQRARTMALDLLLGGPVPKMVLDHLLASLARLDGHFAVGDAIEGACVDGEIVGECPNCAAEVYVTPRAGGIEVQGGRP
jgi:hypothetical protein